MLSTILYTTYSVYHARMGGVAAAVLDEILDKLSIQHQQSMNIRLYYHTISKDIET